MHRDSLLAGYAQLDVKPYPIHDAADQLDVRVEKIEMKTRYVAAGM